MVCNIILYDDTEVCGMRQSWLILSKVCEEGLGELKILTSFSRPGLD